ncbi:unnamed protein product [Leuciscus chuanchicus]
MALKRKLSSSAQVYESHQSTSSLSSTDAAETHQPVSAGEENGMPMRNRSRINSFVKLHYCDWSGIISDQNAAPINERRAEDQSSLQYSACSLEDHGLQEPLSSGLEVLPPADQQVQTPPAPMHHSPALFHKRFKPDSEKSDCQERQRKKSSFGKLLSLHWISGEHLSLHSSTGQGQKGKFGEENEKPMRKSRRMDSFEKLPSLHYCDQSGSSDQDTAAIYERHTENNILSRYEIGRLLGEGAFGSVYEGKRLEDGLEVAVKIARKPQNMKYIYIAGHPTPFPLEVSLLILANSGPKVSEIIELLDWQDQPDQYIMVLERPSPCKDLWDFGDCHEGLLNEETARFIMAQTTMAAQICCRHGVFHRDIKLENLLINTETLEVKLIDFGCGDLLQESAYERFCGTPSYCPPEYYKEGRYHGEPATVWSLGVLLFLLVCGRFPEPRDTQMIDDDIWSEPGLSNGHRIRH